MVVWNSELGGESSVKSLAQVSVPILSWTLAIDRGSSMLLPCQT